MAIAKKTVKSSKKSTPVEKPSTEAPPVVEAPVVVAVPTALSVLEDKLTSLTASLKDVTMHFKVLKKEYDQLKKTSDKVERKRANARSTPNGFAKPTKISDDLCVFLGVPKGTEKSRTEVTREINKYVKAHDLANPKNKRIILPDATLKKLLNSKTSDEVTYFNLQKFLKHHFIKA
jgi:chromatin remodeling complex protein RSC6